MPRRVGPLNVIATGISASISAGISASISASIMAAALVAALAPAQASASVSAVYGVGSAAVGRAGQTVATPSGDGAAYHNVAALASTKSSVRLGFTGALHAMGITTRCRGAACLAPRRPDATRALTGGWAAQVSDRLGLGVTFSTPATDLVRINAPDPRRPQFPMLDGTSDRFAVYAGAGVRVFPWLEIGVGAQVHAQIASAVHLELDPVNERVDRADVQISLGPDVSATAAVRLRATHGTTLALTWQQQAGVRYEIPASIGFSRIAVAKLRLAQIAHETPHTLRLAAAWTGAALTLEAGLHWALWSRISSLGPDLSSTVTGELVDGVGLGTFTRITAAASDWTPRLRDTISVGVSGRWRARDALTIRAGWRYKPTPFPAATAKAALMDSDAHVFAFGLSLQIARWQFGASAQAWLWQRRTLGTGPVAQHGGTSLVSSFDLSRSF